MTGVDTEALPYLEEACYYLRKKGLSFQEVSKGNEKITFVRENGFYHCRRSDLETMDSPALMNIFESSKKFLDFDMYRRYLDTKPPVGYDPMAMQRQIKRAVELIQEILRQRWEQEKAH